MPTSSGQEPLSSPDADSPPPAKDEERAYRLLVEYDGTHYAGWQRQPKDRTIQQTLEEALARIVQHPVRCDGAGRTDAGVHARGQVVRIRTTAPNVDAEALWRGGNVELPPDVRIVAVEPCDPAFEPRRDARLRHYRYSILTRPSPPALDRHRLLHVPQPLDWAAVERALVLLEGEHDFQAFRSSACGAARTVLTLRGARHVNEHPEHHLDFLCRSFLHSMVRMMTGLVLEIGVGRHAPAVIEDFFRTKRRAVAFRTAPAHGLTLVEVRYEAALDR